MNNEPENPNEYYLPSRYARRAPYIGFTYAYGRKVYPWDKRINKQPTLATFAPASLITKNEK